jgi:hypothetical protein
VVQIIGSGYEFQENVPDMQPRKLEEILQFSTDSKNEKKWGADREDIEETIAALMVMRVPQSMLPLLEQSAIMSTCLFEQEREGPGHPCLSGFESLSTNVSVDNFSVKGLVDVSAPTASGSLCSESLTTGLDGHLLTHSTASSTGAEIDSRNPVGMFLRFSDSSVSRDAAIEDNLQKQGREVPVSVALTSGIPNDGSTFPSAAKVVDNRSNTFIVPPPVIPAVVREEGWQYKFRSWSGRHVVRISTIGDIDDHTEFSEATIDLSPSSELLGQRLRSARGVFESNGKWLLKVHADADSGSHDSLPRQVSEEKDGV